MNTLIIDSVSDRLYVMLLKRDKVFTANSEAERTKHGEIINLKIAEILKICPLIKIDAIAVNVGPGSFTGIRVGIATAYGLSADKGKLFIEVNTHGVLSFLAEGEVNTYISANRGMYYYAKANRGTLLTDSRLINSDCYRELPKNTAAVIDSPRYADALCAAVNKKIADRSFIKRFSPLYVQKSQAEINLNSK